MAARSSTSTQETMVLGSLNAVCRLQLPKVPDAKEGCPLTQGAPSLRGPNSFELHGTSAGGASVCTVTQQPVQPRPHAHGTDVELQLSGFSLCFSTFAKPSPVKLHVPHYTRAHTHAHTHTCTQHPEDSRCNLGVSEEHVG